MKMKKFRTSQQYINTRARTKQNLIIDKQSVFFDTYNMHCWNYCRPRKSGSKRGEQYAIAVRPQIDDAKMVQSFFKSLSLSNRTVSVYEWFGCQSIRVR